MGWILASLAALAVSLAALAWYTLKLAWYVLVFLAEVALAVGRFVGTMIEAYQNRERGRRSNAIAGRVPAPVRRRKKSGSAIRRRRLPPGTP